MNDAPMLAGLERETIGDTSFDIVVAANSLLAKRESVAWGTSLPYR